MAVADNLLRALRTWGPLSGGDLAARLGVSRATLMRAVQALGADVVCRGQARRTTYAARRAVRAHAAPLPVYRIDESGQPHEAAVLAPVHPAGCALEWREPCPWPLEGAMADGWFDGLPWLLDDLRPQGFLGRQFARDHAALLQVAPDPAGWSEDDILHALALLGDDLPGCYVLGEPALRAWLERAHRPMAALTDRQAPAAYARLAAAALTDGVPGSSAGGEFPKFPALRERGGDLRHVLVKFSGDDDSPGTRRWSDLLVCEHLAARALSDHLGVATARTRIVQAAGRTFLEVERFDRHGARGRSPVCTWAALNAGLLGLPSHAWSAGARALRASGWIDASTQAAIDQIWHFGHLIANGDMHDGNLAFLPGLRLAPVYDMLPMRYAPPRAAEVLTPTFAPPLPLPAEREAWSAALPAARAFWAQAASDARISAGFRRTCAANAATLDRLA